MIGFHPQQARYFHELSVRFLANAHPRVEQRVHQVLTAMLLVAAGVGSPSPPPPRPRSTSRAWSSRSSSTAAATPQLDADPERPVELHAIWSREPVTPVVRRVLWRDRQVADVGDR